MEIQQPVTSVLKHLHATQHLKSIIEVTPVSIFFCHAILQVTDPIFSFFIFYFITEERPFKCTICDRGFSTKVIFYCFIFYLHLLFKGKKCLLYIDEKTIQSDYAGHKSIIFSVFIMYTKQIDVL